MILQWSLLVVCSVVGSLAQEYPGPAAPAYGVPVGVDANAAAAAAAAQAPDFLPIPSQYAITNDGGFTAITGYDGILVPEEQNPKFSLASRLAALVGLLSLPKLIATFPLVSGIVGGFGILVLLGGTLVTATCTLTPLCTLSILGARLSQKSLKSAITSIPTEKLKQEAADLFSVVQKYQDLTSTKRRSKNKKDN